MHRCVLLFSRCCTVVVLGSETTNNRDGTRHWRWRQGQTTGRIAKAFVFLSSTTTSTGQGLHRRGQARKRKNAVQFHRFQWVTEAIVEVWKMNRTSSPSRPLTYFWNNLGVDTSTRRPVVVALVLCQCTPPDRRCIRTIGHWCDVHRQRNGHILNQFLGAGLNQPDRTTPSARWGRG